MNSIQKIIVYCAFIGNVYIYPMEKPLVLAGSATVNLLDPAHENNNALHAFYNLNLNLHPQATQLHEALVHASLSRLKAVLSSQLALGIQTKLPEDALPATLDLSGASGFYIRKKRSENKNVDFETTQMAEFIPDPFTCSVTQFSELYSSPDESHYFQHHDSGFKIWDAQTGVCVNDSADFQAQIKKKFPHLVAADSSLVLPSIHGLSQGNYLAWMDLTYKAPEEMESQVAGTYDFKKNRIDYFQFKERLGAVSPSGKLIPIFENASGRVVVAHIDNPSQAVIISEQHDIYNPIIGPQDKYLIYQQLDIDNLSMILYYDLVHNNKRHLSYGKYTKVAFAPSGLKVAMQVGDEQLVIWDLPTNQRITEFKLTNMNDCELIFSSDEAEILVYAASVSPHQPYLLFRVPIVSKETSSPQSFRGDTCADMLFCNQGKYLLLPNSQLLMEPAGMVAHLSLQELVGLLILEQQKTSGTIIDTKIIDFFQRNPVAKIRELITLRYSKEGKRSRKAFHKDFLKRHRTLQESP